MITRRRKVRRKTDHTQKVCKVCLSFLLAVSVIVGPHVWDRVVNLAGKVFAASSGAPVQNRKYLGGM